MKKPATPAVQSTASEEMTEDLLLATSRFTTFTSFRLRTLPRQMNYGTMADQFAG